MTTPNAPADPDLPADLDHQADPGLQASLGSSGRLVALELDCLGQRCPLPVIKLAQQIRNVGIGDVVWVLADDPAAANDIPAWCRMKAQEYLGSPAADTYAVRRLS